MLAPRQKPKAVTRYLSFVSSVISCLCAGSVNTYSLYGHLFQERLAYTQTQVNTVSVAAEIALYLPVSLVGYFCDHIGPSWASLISAILFGIGYTTAAFTYQNGLRNFHDPTKSGDSSVQIMVIAHILIGLATPFMYLSAITTCAKNFRKHRLGGLALASPIAAIGLSSFWQSQVGSRIFSEDRPTGTKGDVDVFKYFIFLAILLVVVGLVGFFLLRLVDEDILISEPTEQHERRRLLESSGHLENSELSRDNHNVYGSADTTVNDEIVGSQDTPRIRNVVKVSLKTRFLNRETVIFLKDRTMWWFAAGFLMVSGPCEVFITNLGTIIGTLHPPHPHQNVPKTSAAVHISIVSISSTIARLTFSTLTDIFAPTCRSQHNSPDSRMGHSTRLIGLTISRITILVGSALSLSLGQILLASGLMQNHAERFWVVSVLNGAAYGVLFSLTPIIISIVWGVNNFGTNWGIIGMIPAIGTVFWSFVYSSIYEAGARSPVYANEGDEDVLCHGKVCYSTTFWAMAGSVWLGCGCWIWAWKGRRGWASRGVYI